MPNAVIVAHGQPSDPIPAEEALQRLAAEIDRITARVSVTSATLAAPGALETMLDGLSGETVVYPLFMAKGWFVTSALPKRIGGRSVRVLDPLGVDPDLPRLVASAIEAQLEQLGWSSSETDLVIAAHGSGRSRNPSTVAMSFAGNLGRRVSMKSIRVGFVEEPPSIRDAAIGTVDTALCLPFFACTGGHVLDDVPTELQRAAFRGHVMPVVGELETIKHHIARLLDAEFAAPDQPRMGTTRA